MVWGSKVGGVEIFWYPTRLILKPTQTCAQRVPGLSWVKGARGCCWPPIPIKCPGHGWVELCHYCSVPSLHATGWNFLFVCQKSYSTIKYKGVLLMNIKCDVHINNLFVYQHMSSSALFINKTNLIITITKHCIPQAWNNYSLSSDFSCPSYMQLSWFITYWHFT
jgi:hypothetical protein